MRETETMNQTVGPVPPGACGATRPGASVVPYPWEPEERTAHRAVVSLRKRQDVAQSLSARRSSSGSRLRRIALAAPPTSIESHLSSWCRRVPRSLSRPRPATRLSPLRLLSTQTATRSPAARVPVSFPRLCGSLHRPGKVTGATSGNTVFRPRWVRMRSITLGSVMHFSTTGLIPQCPHFRTSRSRASVHRAGHSHHGRSVARRSSTLT